MKAAAFEYLRPRDLGAAIQALAQSDGEAKLLAGGQSLVPMLNLRLARPRLLVDVSRLDALRAIEPTANGWRIGAAVTHAALEDARGRLAGGEMLCEVAGGIAYRAVRNRGTIGGSMAHADPAADWPLALAALGAAIVIRGGRGRRSVAAEEFMSGAFTTALADDELIECVEVPRLSGAARWGYYKFCRKTGEFPEASAAAVLDPERGIARVYVGALHGAPRALRQLARQLASEGAAAASAAVLEQAVGQAAPELDAIERRMHAVAVARAIRKALPQ
jgi:carbon-monoxide dehydrogenase medium subunit